MTVIIIKSGAITNIFTLSGTPYTYDRKSSEPTYYDFNGYFEKTTGRSLWISGRMSVRIVFYVHTIDHQRSTYAKCGESVKTV